MMMMTTLSLSNDDDEDDDDEDNENVKEEKVGVVLYAPGPTQVTTATQVCCCSNTLHCTGLYWMKCG